MRTGLVQLCASDDPVENIPITVDLVRTAARDGASFVLTPEVTNCVSASRARQADVLSQERTDPTLAALRDEASALGIWLLIGSLALKGDAPEDRWANRSFLVSPDGVIRARYDKIHMFDVAVSKSETYRESQSFRPGDRAVIADVEGVRVGLSICYDLRFPQLFRSLSSAGAQILTVPSAFTPETGRAHWEPLLRARAIENGAFVLAPAQCGTHSASEGRARVTHGHSLAVSPWGEVLADGGDMPGVTMVDLDLSLVDSARGRIPSLIHDREIKGP